MAVTSYTGCRFHNVSSINCTHTGVQLSARRRARLPVDHVPTTIREHRPSLYTWNPKLGRVPCIERRPSLVTFGCTWTRWRLFLRFTSRSFAVQCALHRWSVNTELCQRQCANTHSLTLTSFCFQMTTLLFDRA